MGGYNLPNVLAAVCVGKTFGVSDENIFAAGDARRGQSLIVWAISEGREAAHQIDSFLMGSSKLPQKNTLKDLIAV